MKTCSNCRNVVQDNISYCPNCGSNYCVYDTDSFQYQCSNQYNNQSSNYNQYNNQYNNQYPNQQKSNLGEPIIWGVVGFFIFIVGIILYFVWKNSNPEHAKAAGMGALIRLGIALAFALLTVSIR